jgi:hypothetical protein
VPDYPLAAILIAGPIVFDFDSTAATVIALAFGAGGRAARPRSAGGGVSRASDCSLMTGDEPHTDTAVVVVGRVALALVGARMTPHNACLDRGVG